VPVRGRRIAMDYRRIVTRVVAGVALAGLASAIHADTFFVDDDNCPGAGSGTEGDPYCSIQTAIDNAVDTDEIVVAPGTYFECINFLGKAVTVRSSGGPQVTIIDAGGPWGCGSAVTCDSGEGADSVLDGFTITGGAGTYVDLHHRGGGMYNVNSTPTVANCTFSANGVGVDAALRGGGMYNNNSSPAVANCTFIGNHARGFWSHDGVNLAGYGGGMYNGDGSNPTVTDCTFSGNEVRHYFGSGGGMYNRESNPTVTNCAFNGNHGWMGGVKAAGCTTTKATRL
jgi:hypothetical protein